MISISPQEERNPKRRRNDHDDIQLLTNSEDSRDSCYSETSDIFTANTSANTSRPLKRRVRQASLLTSGFTRDLESRTPSPVFQELSQFRSQRTEPQRVSGFQDSVKVEVQVEGHLITTKLRIQEDSEDLVNTLRSSVMTRFEELTGCRGRLELTASGVLLQPDNIVNIIYKSEGALQLAGRVLDLQIPSIVERFEKISRGMRIEVQDPEVLRSLKSCKNTGTFRLKSDDGADLDLPPILRSLEYEKSLQVLHLSSGVLYDLGESVNETLGKLTGLQELHLQGCDIDHQFLELIDELPQNLRVLDLSYNPLGASSQEKLGSLISPLRQLQTLHLRSCQLERFPAITVSSSLVNLDVSGNFIEGDSAEGFLQREIVSLSISNTCHPRNSMLEVMMKGSKTIFMSLESLELRGCGLSNSDVLHVLDKCHNLSKFVLGDNPEVTQVSLEALVGRKPTLVMINVTGCERVDRIPSFGLRICNPEVCTLMASLADEVCEAWKDLWGRQALLYKQPHDIVVIRPIT